MKKFFLVLIFALSLITLVACGDSENVELNGKISDIPEKIMDEIEFPEMVEATPDNIQIMYALEVNVFEDYSIYYAGSGGYADEISVIEVSSKDEVKNIKKVFEDRVEARIKVFEGYAPLEAEKLENAVIKTQGNYVFLVICEDPDKAKKIFVDSFVK